MNSVKEMIHAQFAIPVLRETRPAHLENVAKALGQGGLKVMEITLMSDHAYDVISKLSQDKNLVIGAGTVLNAEQAKKAMDAGARFIVSPGLSEEVIKVTSARSILCIPGALTPTEVMRAHNLNCEMIKIFPVASVGGVSYLRSLQGPFPSLSFMATGGITFSDIFQYVKSGCTAIGLGNHLTPTELINGQNWEGLTILAEQHVEAVKQARVT